MFVNVPIGILCCLLARALIRKDAPPVEQRNLDVLGALASTIVAALLSIALLVLFVVVEKRAKDPVLRLEVFSDGPWLGANMTMLLGSAGLVASLFTLSFFLQRGLSINPVASGLAFLPTSVVFVLTTNLSSRLVSRLGARSLVASGSIAMAAGFLLYSRMESPSQFLALYIGGSLLTGLFGLAIPMLFLVAVAGVEPVHRGVASGLLNTSQQVGAALGLAIATMVGSMARARLAGGSGEGGPFAAAAPREGFIVCAGFLVTAVLIAISLMG